MDSYYLDQVVKGNRDAFGYFIRTYQNRAYGIAFSIVKQEMDAEDVVQDSFITAYSSLGKFKRESKFSTWFYRIVVNTSLEHKKRKKRTSELQTIYTLSENDINICNEALEQLEKEELKELVKRILIKLPSKEALVLRLFYLDDLKISEIVEVTNLTKSNIKVLLHRARTNFYKVLKKERITKPYENGK